MRLFMQELKKLWQPGLVALLVLAGGIWLAAAGIAYVKPANPDTKIALGRELAVQYGPTLEDDEFAALQAQLPALRAELDAAVARHPLAQQYGITGYAALEQFLADTETPLPEGSYVLNPEDLANRPATPAHEAALQIMTGIGRDEPAFARCTALENACDRYQAASASAGQGWRGILPAPADTDTLAYAEQCLVWIVLSVLVLVSCPLVGDRAAGMRALQWSSKCGRRILAVQLGAALLSALVWVALNLCVFAALFRRNGYGLFDAAQMGSFLADGQIAVDLRYGGWCLLLMGLCLPLGLGTAALGFFAARYSDSRIGMVLKLIPLGVAAVLFSIRSVENTATSRYADLPAILLFFAAALALCLAACARQDRAELLNT